MGGLMMIAALLVSTLVWIPLSGRVFLALWLFLGYAGH